MNKSRVKRIIGLCGLAIGLFSALLLTARVGGFIESTRTGADLVATLSELEVPVSAEVITWLPDADLARPLDPTARDAIADAYVLGLDILDGRVEVPPEKYSVHLTGGALLAAQTRNTRQEPPLRRAHTMRVVFHSADGQVIELEDSAAVAVAAAGRVVTRNERAVVVLILIDGVWHLRHRVITDLETELISSPSQEATKGKKK